jgi:putative aldouronate transport system substrate-binding protein
MEEIMKKRSFILTLLVMLTIPALLVSAGGSKQSGGSAAGGPVKLTVAVPESLRIENYKTNIMTKMLEERANVDLTFVPLASSDYNNKLNLMAMAGGNELPDIILGMSDVYFQDSMVYQWAQEGAIIPLTKYYKDPGLSPNLHDAVKRVGTNFFSQITSPDGEIYGIPVFNQSYYNEYPAKYMYYKPWVDKLGLKLPTTTEEYRTFLRAIANGDPNGNGKKDEVPLTGQFALTGANYDRWFGWVMNSFIYAGDRNLLTVTDGKVGAAYTTNEWKEGLKFMRSLFAEGLIPTEALTQDENQMRTLINQDGPVVFSFVWFNPDGINANNPAGDNYSALPPLKGPAGVQYLTYRPSVAYTSFVISKNCKNPDAAFKVGDLLASEEIGIMQRFGAEGKEWDYAKNVKDLSNYATPVPNWPFSIIVYNDANFWGGSAVANSSWRQSGPYIRTYGIANGMGNTKEAVAGRTGNNGINADMYQKGGWNPKQVIPKLIYTADEVGEITEILTNLENYNTSMTAAFLSGNRNIDSSWNEYQAELNRIGVARAVSIIQKVYDRMYK